MKDKRTCFWRGNFLKIKTKYYVKICHELCFLWDFTFFFPPCRSVTLQRKKKNPLPQAGFLSARKLDTARDDLFRCCPCQSTRFDPSFPPIVIGKHTVCVRHRTLKSSTATELGTVVTWASAHKSAPTGGLAGFTSVCWWALNIFQMCWPHKTATYHRLWKNCSKTVFPIPTTTPLGSRVG